MALYAADGSVNVTVVTGLSYTGLRAADGSYNVIHPSGGGAKGAYHPCGALLVTNTSTYAHNKAADGTRNVFITGGSHLNKGHPVTVVSGSL